MSPQPFDPAVAEAMARVDADLAVRWPESKLEPSLKRIAYLVDILGAPQTTYPVIHITGTNGKTSTARIVESLLSAYGMRVGRYTSPHLSSARERIAIDGAPISPEAFVTAYDDVAPYIEMADAWSLEHGGPRLSFFEVITAVAFAAFADAPVGVAVVEVGLGGSWDATNVANGAVSVVTPISLDHTEYLGDSVEDIANEKAGILTEGSFAVLAQQPLEAAEVLLRRSAEVGATVAREGLEFGVVNRTVAVGGQMLTLKGLAGTYDEVFLPLHGAHQAQNAAVALAAVEAFL